MIQKNEFCKYCGKELEAKTAKKVFCDDKCRIYYKRELVRGTLVLPKVGQHLGTGIITERKQHNHALTITINPTGINNDSEILNQIEEIKKEKIPKERDTTLGKKMWSIDQQKRISELQNKLK